MLQHGLESRLEAAEQQVARFKVTADDYLKQLQEANAARARLQQVGHLVLQDPALVPTHQQLYDLLLFVYEYEYVHVRAGELRPAAAGA